jgi:hypothetical protein
VARHIAIVTRSLVVQILTATKALTEDSDLRFPLLCRPVDSLQNNSDLLQRNSNTAAIEFQKITQTDPPRLADRRVKSQFGGSTPEAHKITWNRCNTI